MEAWEKKKKKELKQKLDYWNFKRKLQGRQAASLEVTQVRKEVCHMEAVTLLGEEL